jgi:hypothetical protein
MREMIDRSAPFNVLPLARGVGASLPIQPTSRGLPAWRINNYGAGAEANTLQQWLCNPGEKRWRKATKKRGLM